MKKFLFMLIMSVVALFLGTTVTSCDSAGFNKLCTVDTTQVSKIVNQFVNPHFTNADEFSHYAKDEVLYRKFVDTSSQLSQTTIKIIASKVISDYGFVEYRMFLEEYAANKTVYDNVEKTNAGKESERAAPVVIDLDTVPPIIPITKLYEGDNSIVRRRISNEIRD